MTLEKSMALSLKSMEARKMMDFLRQVEGKKIISGQHCNKASCPDMEYLYKKTGKYPLMLGLDLLSYSNWTNTRDASWECIDEIANNRKSIEAAINWAEQGGIVTFCWHWFSPLGGRDKSFYTKNTEIHFADAFDGNKALYDAICQDIDTISLQLRRLRDAHIPVLWRPLHEGHGSWFWWGAQSDEDYIKLYQFMYHRMTVGNKLDNLIWIWNAPDLQRYPGDAYVDICSIDTYKDKLNSTVQKERYELLCSASHGTKMNALSEVGTPPAIDTLFSESIYWVWFMLWQGYTADPTYNTVESLNEVFHDPRVLTL